MTNHDTTTTDGGSPRRHHCTLAVVRALTRPLIYPPSVEELTDTLLLSPWNIRVPVDPEDYTTRHHWKSQKHTDLFHSMLDWEPKSKSVASLHPYFSFGSPSSPFFAPWEDVGNCLRNLLLHQIEGHQDAQYMTTLTSHDTHLFVATSPSFQEQDELKKLHNTNHDPNYYLLRCHYDKHLKHLIFGYHSNNNNNDDASSFLTFHKLVELSLVQDDDWRLKACIILRNLARILHCLKDYTVPLVWSHSTKLSLVQYNNDKLCVQKVYTTDRICNTFNATVTNMIRIYESLENAKVPYTDRLVSVVKEEEQTDDDDDKKQNSVIICKFAPIGRSYLPETVDELLEALICVTKALVAMHAIRIMHRDIRWANVFRVLDDTAADKQHHHHLKREWILFDLEFAAFAPQPAFAPHTLTPGNHAPEMVDTDDEHHTEPHDTAVDIWGLGYLIQKANVDVPLSHAEDLLRLQSECLQSDPRKRPTATKCLEVLYELNARTCSTEKTVSAIV